jgi:hypothetical protein
VPSGSSGEGFGNLLLVLTAAGIALATITTAIAKKKGVNTNSPRFIIGMILAVSALFVGIPFWLTDISLFTKIWGTALALAVGVLNYVGTERLRKALWGHRR